jgi:hypothetical protein
VKDAAHSATHSTAAEEARVDAERTRVHAEHTSNDMRDKIVNGADQLKESISRGLHNLQHEVNK